VKIFILNLLSQYFSMSISSITIWTNFPPNIISKVNRPSSDLSPNVGLA
jgi:hypothetical protein